MPVQVNLKQTVVFDQSETFQPPADLRAGDVFGDLQHLAGVQAGQTLITSSAVLQRPRLGLSFLPVRHPDLANNALISLPAPLAALIPPRVCTAEDQPMRQAPQLDIAALGAAEGRPAPALVLPLACCLKRLACAGAQGRTGALHRRQRAVERPPASTVARRAEGRDRCCRAGRGASERHSARTQTRRSPEQQQQQRR